MDSRDPIRNKPVRGKREHILTQAFFLYLSLDYSAGDSSAAEFWQPRSRICLSYTYLDERASSSCSVGQYLTLQCLTTRGPTEVSIRPSVVHPLYLPSWGYHSSS